MKKPGFVDFLWSYLFIMAQLIYLFIEPLIFSTVGLICQVRWPFYLASIGGYYALTALWELIAYLKDTGSGKRVHSPFVRRLKKVLAQFADDAQEPKNTDQEEN